MKRSRKTRLVHARPSVRPLRAGKRYSSRRLTQAIQTKQNLKWQRRRAKHPVVSARIDRAVLYGIIGKTTFVPAEKTTMDVRPRAFVLTRTNPLIWGEPDFGSLPGEND